MDICSGSDSTLNEGPDVLGIRVKIITVPYQQTNQTFENRGKASKATAGGRLLHNTISCKHLVIDCDNNVDYLCTKMYEQIIKIYSLLNSCILFTK